MEESKDCRSISLSLFLVRLFAIAFAALDIAIWPISGALRQVLPFFGQADAVLLTVCLYLCNVPGFWLLRCMGVLLRNLRKGKVFVEGNVQLLRQISLCCFGACAICFAGCFRIYSLGVIALAAGFMGLVVRIVKNVFAQAVPMRDELDLTV